MSTEQEKIKPLHVEVAELLIEQLKAGTAPWQKPWSADPGSDFQLPYNAITGNRYKGINTFSLMLRGRPDPRWMTFNQAASQGWNVRKGEKGTGIQYVRLFDERTRRDEQGKPVIGPDGKPEKVTVKLERPIITSAKVFNAAQVEGIPELKITEPKELGWDPMERAEALLKSSGANLVHRSGDRAFYSLLADQITMPVKEQFDVPDKYYATVLHELGHWTGHSSRLDRSMMNHFGSESYAREELRAEIASMLLGQEMRIGHDPGQHAAYVQSWVQILTDTPFEIHSAAADAEKIFNYLLDLERRRNVVQQVGDQAEPAPARKAAGLQVMDEIAYNDTVFKVVGHLKQGRFRMENMGSQTQFTLSKTDGLYQSLVNAKQQQQEKPVLQVRPEALPDDRNPGIKAAYGLKR